MRFVTIISLRDRTNFETPIVPIIIYSKYFSVSDWLKSPRLILASQLVLSKFGEFFNYWAIDVNRLITEKLLDD